MKRLLSPFIVAIPLTIIAPCVEAAPGDLDPAFGVNGMASFTMGNAAHSPTGIVTMPDGRYYVSFEAPVSSGGAIGGTIAGSEPRGGGIARFNADHTLDTSWGYRGIAGLGLSVAGIAWQNGNLVAIEHGNLPLSAPTPYAPSSFAQIVRYTTSGDREASFGGGNGHSQPISSNQGLLQQKFEALAIATDNKFVAVGEFEGYATVARFLPDGYSDPAFGDVDSRGRTRVRVSPGSPSVVRAVAVRPDGSIIIAGSFGTTPQGFVAKLTSTGALDTSFGVGGVFSETELIDCRSVLVEATRIVAGCTTHFAGDSDILVLGLTPTGAFDLTFENSLIDLGGTQDKLLALSRYPNGGFLAVGRGGASGNQLGVVAVNLNGYPLSSFGNNGIYLAPETNAGDAAALGWNGSEILVASRRTLAVIDDVVMSRLSLAGVRNAVGNTSLSFSQAQFIRPKVLPDGRVLAIGNVSVAGQGAFRVLRFMPDGSLDTAFGPGGLTSFVTGDEWFWGAREFVLQPDGKIVVTGGFGSPTNESQTLGVARVLADGGLDPAFNAGSGAGQSSFLIPNSINVNAGRSVRLQADGKIVMAARLLLNDGSGTQMIAARFNADGSRDMVFGVSGLAKSAFVGGATQCRAMDMDGSGRAVLMGDGQGAVRLTRFTTAGALDPAFGNGGMVAHPLPAGYSLLFTAAIGFVLPSGKILAVLNATKGGDAVAGLMRANADGTLDTSFGIGGFGFVTVAAGAPNNGNVFHAAIAPNGRIAVVGFGRQVGGTADIPMIARFMPDGRPDISFGEGGVRFYPQLPDSWMIGLAFAADGAMVVTGSSNGGGRIFPNLFKTVPDGNAIGPNLLNAVSRKQHAGHAAPFDLKLDTTAGISGPVTAEPRLQGDGHTIVFQFDTAITSVASASIENSSGVSLGAVMPVASANEVSLLLPPMSDMTRAKVNLTGVNGIGSAGINVGFLFG
ncbi:MAG: hypothetical protein JNN20_08900, partial [Betaproteobacteria bacterium]|nr:hypothetical protein [Betaproteobacteria bacterium]